MKQVETVENFTSFVNNVERKEGYRRPYAFGVGLATFSAEGNVLDTFFPFPNVEKNFGAAAVFAEVVGHECGTNTYVLDFDCKEKILHYFAPFLHDGKKHDNISAVQTLFAIVEADRAQKRVQQRKVVISFIDQAPYDKGPCTVSDAYLRLHLLSHRLVLPNTIALEGIFSVLPSVAWTSEGPVAVNEVAERKMLAYAEGRTFFVRSVDKFPAMLDYVIPSGVRIADGARVRLGAYLAEGTTVMQEGFCNFNAGTKGPAMVEGRISQGVVIGKKTDIGGGASIMGTLSGGGKITITIGEYCLLGANAGVGICLGDNCQIEAGLYITAGVKVLYEGVFVKASELSGVSNLTFRRNGTTGIVEVLPTATQSSLNPALHSA